MMGEYGRRALENGVLARMIGPNGNKVTGRWKALHIEDLHNLKLRTNIVIIVTCGSISRKRLNKHVSAEIRFLEINRRWVLNKGFLGYENG
jgi:hypothetical protein